eukprot:m.80431 g.80431  ORF g.80431 m.80431 type:complete len:95 (-) comp12758_c0_seq2:9-293(-)
MHKDGSVFCCTVEMTHCIIRQIVYHIMGRAVSPCRFQPFVYRMHRKHLCKQETSKHNDPQQHQFIPGGRHIVCYKKATSKVVIQQKEQLVKGIL